jgi:hypothetical protein
MSEMEAEFLRRTGKQLADCSKAEIEAEIARLTAEGEAHRQHGDELLQFADERRADAVANDNGDAA